MAIIWETDQDGNHYEVRTAGRSIRLYRNNVFHSQWNEQRPLSGGVWDLLFLPALFMPLESVKRVLVLGVGGGAVIRQYLAFLPLEKIVGVELDPVHLQVAQDHFGVKQACVELIQADAIEWVKSYCGPKFDVVVEDVFTDVAGEPVRVQSASREWMHHLRRLTHPKGTLILNFEDSKELQACCQTYFQTNSAAQQRCYGFTLPSYGNCVGAFLASPSDPAQLQTKLQKLLNKFPASRQSGQQFRIRSIPAEL